MDTAFGIAAMGLTADSARFQSAASRVVKNPSDVTAIADTTLSEIGFKADLAVMKTADDMTKRALDILA